MKMKVLWLASWYPNKYEPVNGDFVQRHAQAVASILPIHVIHVVQAGKDKQVEDDCITNQQHNLTETIYSFSFKKTGIAWLDKIRYNVQYRSFYLHVLTKYIQENGKPDIIHVHVPMKAGLAAMQMKQLFSIPFIVSEQASYYEAAAPDTFAKRSFFFKKNTQQIFQKANVVTNVSNTIGLQIQRMFNLKKVIPIHNVVNTNTFFPKHLQEASLYKWVHVSTLGEQKNIEGLIAAFQQLHETGKDNWQLTLVGPYKEYHIELVKNAGLSNKVIFTGELVHQQVADQLQKSHAFVLFSRHENFPCVIPEALCCGLPVVAANVGGVAEAIDESNGIIVQSQNTTMLAEAILKVMTNFHSYNTSYIAASAANKYSFSTIGGQFVEQYKNILN